MRLWPRRWPPRPPAHCGVDLRVGPAGAPFLLADCEQLAIMARYAGEPDRDGFIELLCFDNPLPGAGLISVRPVEFPARRR